ncbi:DUF4880 domain-containing protein [Methylobacterium sp. E-065]|uniref:FecR family protein n=1 Tax=Methylobacterium sp. E-065 TaxID=2836583 RepID=UPI001FBA444B|nr:DUF4880 domain-containing protein [Methylobacterium sp. E-065]MCJ2020809.1 DUF4880 domain-containing protein [Methylobacterium sp. E-065]
MSEPNQQHTATNGDDHSVRRQAHAWVVHLTSGTATQDDAQALAAWRSTPEHDAAFRAAAGLWRRAGDALASTAGPAIAREAPRGMTRRRMLGRVAAGGVATASIAAAGATLVLRLPTLRAAYRTGIGEIRTVTLPAGIRIELDAETALDAQLDDMRQAIVLHAGSAAVTVPATRAPLTMVVGEVRLITEPSEPAEVVIRCRPRGGLSGWVGGQDVDVACLFGRVTVVAAPGIPATRLAAGQEVEIGPDARSPHAIDVAATAAWRRGLLVFRDTPLSQVVDDLNRYRPGRIVVASSATAARRVTGVFHLARPEEALGSIRTALALSEVRFGDRLVVLR